MDNVPPPPPPPHGENPKTSSGLPAGNYDIFIIPPHSSGSGFLYLPSLRPNVNSFIAGAAFAFFLSWLWSSLAPTVKAFVQTVTHSGTGAGMLVVTLLVGSFAWYIGHAGVVPTPGGPGATGAGPERPPPPNGYPSGGPPPGAGQQQQPPPNGFPGGGPTPRPAGAGWGGNPQGHAGPGYGQNTNGGYNQHQQQYEQPPPRQPSPPPREPSPPPPPPRTEPYGARSEADSSERPQPRARSYSNASASWQKAKEETKKREEERKRQEDARRKQEEDEKRKAEAERQARAAAEKEKWEKMRAREKEVREREARERLVRERVAKERETKEKLEREIRERVEREQAEKDALAQNERTEKEAQAQKERVEKEAQAAKEKAERDARVQAARERLEKARMEEKARLEAAAVAVPKSVFGVGERTNPYSLDNKSTAPTPAALAAAAAAANPAPSSAGFGPGAASAKKPAYERPSAQSYVGTSTDTAYRPYDKVRPKHTSGSSVYSSAYSESYAPSQSTAPSSAPSRSRGPYSTSDPDKVVIKAVYSFSDNFPKPTACLVAGEDGCTDGTVLRITTEGMFVDDDIKGIGMREWDLKAWTMKSVETVTKNNLHIVRATIRDATNKNYVFVIADSEEWKVAVGLQKLKKGPLVRSFALTTLSAAETTKLMGVIGW